MVAQDLVTRLRSGFLKVQGTSEDDLEVALEDTVFMSEIKKREYVLPESEYNALLTENTKYIPTVYEVIRKKDETTTLRRLGKHARKIGVLVRNNVTEELLRDEYMNRWFPDGIESSSHLLLFSYYRDIKKGRYLHAAHDASLALIALSPDKSDTDIYHPDMDLLLRMTSELSDEETLLISDEFHKRFEYYREIADSEEGMRLQAMSNIWSNYLTILASILEDKRPDSALGLYREALRFKPDDKSSMDAVSYFKDRV